MKISQTENDGEITITLSGLLSGAKNSIEIFENLSNMITKKPKKILINMSMVAFIDSMFIGLLVGAYLKCKENNVTFQFVELSPQVSQIFKDASLNLLFPDMASENE